ncbi:RagB/SusD family nutrient uptake outer membrane protein [Arcticibacter eurypsychrophilus]|uniref:RagB/SusD family nutrient uptake outer membrane protein n=1 Tax=Arcticibacter eurypsychrophilus TaxID=1434752 RepID=UPI0009F2D65E|nr:RagB/SusD family nutrient uptake outer membrane protein [Arcticibacter eurypsychrophilus]
MKKLVNNLLKGGCFCLFFTLFISCNEYLEKPPLSEIAPENYLNDESHLSAYAIARYNFRTQALQADNTGPYTDDTNTDNQASRSYNNRFVPGQWRVGASGGDWGFGNIYPLNYFIQTVMPRYGQGKITGSATNIKHNIGEVYFLRAFEYFEKLKILGDFPIIRTTLPDEKMALVEASKRMPRTEVARFILSDLDSAILFLNNSPVGGKNRITQAAAYLFKSRVALFEGTWLKYHKGTALVPNGPGWPGAEKDYNKGYQFKSGSIDGEIDFFLSQSMAAAKVVADAYPLAVNTKVIRATLSDNNPYFDMFALTDLSTYGEILLWRSYSTALGLAHSANHYLQFNGGSNGYTRGYVDNFLMLNGLPIYAAGSGYAGDDSVQLVKKNRDWRLQLFMKAPGEVKALTNVATTQYEGYPNVWTASDGKNNYATGYPIKKGLSYDYTQQQLSQTVVGSVVFRAAEAYLNYLEANYEKDGALDGLSVSYWRKLRDRAGVNADYNITIAATQMSEEAKNDWGAYSKGVLINPTLYNIRRERRGEFIADGMRWNDLIRWRALDQLATNPYQIEGFKLWGPMEKWYNKPTGESNLTATNVSSKTLSVYLRVNQINTTGNLVYGGYKWTEAHYLSPIAIQHFLLSTTDGATISTSPIYQNPGWPTVADQAPTSK